MVEPQPNTTIGLKVRCPYGPRFWASPDSERSPKEGCREVTWYTVNKDDIHLRSVIEEYLQYHDGLNHSLKTIRWYSDILLALSGFLGTDTRLRDPTGRHTGTPAPPPVSSPHSPG